MTTRLYEGMFLLDNQLVRTDWNAAKALVTGLVEKHGGTVRTARHWDERRLAYPIKKKNRATFLLTYCDLPTDSIPPLTRDLELTEPVLRYLVTTAKEIPEKELELHRNETSTDFVLPEPPPDDHSDEPEPEPEPRRRRSESAESTESTESRESTEAKASTEAKEATHSKESTESGSDGDSEGSSGDDEAEARRKKSEEDEEEEED